MLVGREQLLLWPTTELQAGQGGGWNSWQHESRVWARAFRYAGRLFLRVGMLGGKCAMEQKLMRHAGEGTSSERPQNNQGLCAAAQTRASRTAIITCTPRPHLTVRKRLVS